MSFRTIVIKNRCKLDYSLNYMVYRGEVTKKVHLSEISMLIVESTAVSITAVLINELIKNNIAIVFCDEKHSPKSLTLGYHNNYHSAKNIAIQATWKENVKIDVWTNIIYNKINNQAKLLHKYNLDNKLLMLYLEELQPGDSTNREGHSAKVYFNLLFDMLSRRVPSFYNYALNYGYAILLSAFCREIIASGYITELGIWHHNEFNHFNLASDLMETFRVIVDDMALKLDEKETNYKAKMANILNVKVFINGKNVYLDNAIQIYVKSVLSYLSNGKGEISNYKNYELPIYENDDNV